MPESSSCCLNFTIVNVTAGAIPGEYRFRVVQADVCDCFSVDDEVVLYDEFLVCIDRGTVVRCDLVAGEVYDITVSGIFCDVPQVDWHIDRGFCESSSCSCSSSSESASSSSSSSSQSVSCCAGYDAIKVGANQIRIWNCPPDLCECGDTIILSIWKGADEIHTVAICNRDPVTEICTITTVDPIIGVVISVTFDYCESSSSPQSSSSLSSSSQSSSSSSSSQSSSCGDDCCDNWSFTYVSHGGGNYTFRVTSCEDFCSLCHASPANIYIYGAGDVLLDIANVIGNCVYNAALAVYEFTVQADPTLNMALATYFKLEACESSSSASLSSSSSLSASLSSSSLSLGSSSSPSISLSMSSSSSISASSSSGSALGDLIITRNSCTRYTFTPSGCGNYDLVITNMVTNVVVVNQSGLTSAYTYTFTADGVYKVEFTCNATLAAETHMLFVYCDYIDCVSDFLDAVRCNEPDPCCEPCPPAMVEIWDTTRRTLNKILTYYGDMTMAMFAFEVKYGTDLSPIVGTKLTYVNRIINAMKNINNILMRCGCDNKNDLNNLNC